MSLKILSRPYTTYSFINITQVWVYVCADSVAVIFYLLFHYYKISLSVWLWGFCRDLIHSTLSYIQHKSECMSLRILSRPYTTYSFINITQVLVYVCADSVAIIFYLLFHYYNISLSVWLWGFCRDHILSTLSYIQHKSECMNVWLLSRQYSTFPPSHS
jgi:hypothetical protein